MVSRDQRKEVRHAQTEKFIDEFLENNPNVSQHALLRALNNARLDPVPYIIARKFSEHLEKRAKKTNAPPALVSLQIHPAKPVIANGPRPVIPDVEPRPAVPSLTVVQPKKEEHTTMASNEVKNEKTEINSIVAKLREVMKTYAIASAIITIPETGKPNVEVSYKKGNSWDVE